MRSMAAAPAILVHLLFGFAAAGARAVFFVLMFADAAEQRHIARQGIQNE
jgi:hypothetical protein